MIDYSDPQRGGYSDAQREAFCSLAADKGIAPAIRELGYPSFPTAQKWLRARGIKVSIDSLMAQVRQYHILYSVEDMLTVVESGVARAMETYQNNPALSPNDQQRTASAVQKLITTWQTLNGRASQITENRESDPLDVALVQLLDAERLRNGRTAANVEVSQSAELFE